MRDASVMVFDLEGLGASELASLSRIVSADERVRAHRLPAPEARNHVVGRAVVRLLLGSRQGVEPAQVVIQLDDHGRPRCPAGPDFNVSHSGTLLAVGLGTQRLGVDVQRARPGVRGLEVLLTPEERSALGVVPGATPATATAAWCLVEALAKHIGLGLHPELASRRPISMRPDEAGWSWADTEIWSQLLVPGPHWCLAVASPSAASWRPVPPPAGLPSELASRLVQSWASTPSA